MTEKTIAAIDLGTHKLKLCISAIGDDNRPRVIYMNDAPSSGIKGGRVINPTRLADALKGLIGQAQRCLNIHINEVIVGMQKCGIRTLETRVNADADIESGIGQSSLDLLDELARQSIADSLAPEEEILCMLPQGYNTDDEINVNGNDVLGMMTSRIEGLYKVIVGKSSSLKYIDAAFEKCGINLVRKSFSPIMEGFSTLTPMEMEEGVALVDFGGGTTSVSIFSEGILRHYGAIPFGGGSISNDIKNVCSLPDELAENVKLAFGGCLPDKLASLGEKILRINNIGQNGRIELSVKYLSEIITARTSEIIDSVLWEIQQSGMADNLRSGIVITGSSAQMLNLCTLFTQKSGYNARIAGPQEKYIDSDLTAFFSSSQSVCAALTLEMTGQEGLEGGITAIEGEVQAQAQGGSGEDSGEKAKTDEGSSIDTSGDTTWFGNIFSDKKKKKKVKKQQAKKPEEAPKNEEESKGIIETIGEGLFDDEV